MSTNFRKLWTISGLEGYFVNVSISESFGKTRKHMKLCISIISESGEIANHIEIHKNRN